MFPAFGCPGARFRLARCKDTSQDCVPRSALARYILRYCISSSSARGDSGANGLETAHLLRDRDLSGQSFDGRCSEKTVDTADVVDNPCSVVRFRDWSTVTKYEHVR